MGIKKSYLVQQQAQGKMLREYFSGTPAETLSRRYGYSEKKIKLLASETRWMGDGKKNEGGGEESRGNAEDEAREEKEGEWKRRNRIVHKFFGRGAGMRLEARLPGT